MSDSDFSGGGGMTGQHAPLGPRKFAAAPTVANGLNTIRIPLVAVACWRLNDPAFDFDSSFVLPSFCDELTKLAQLVSANPGCPAAIFGHADPVGSDEVNKTISDRRAIAIYALLTRQPSKWEDLYSKPVDGDSWGTRSIQAMLNTVPDGSGVPYYPGPIDGDYGPNTKSAVRSFQTDAGLAVDGDAGPNTRKILFGAYMDLLCTPSDSGGDATAPFRMAASDFLGKGVDPNGKMALQGCSRFNPVILLPNTEMNGENQETRNADDAPNRRILMFLFRKNTQVDPGDWPCPRVGESADACKGQFWPDGDQRRKNGDALRRYQETRDTMACRFYDRLARRSPCEGRRVPTRLLKIVLLGLDRRPLSKVSFTFTCGDRTIVGITADNGELICAIPNDAVAGLLATAVYTWELDLVDLPSLGADAADKGISGVQTRLSNLGYDPGDVDGIMSDATIRALKEFQTDNHLTPAKAGDFDDATRAKIKELYGS